MNFIRQNTPFALVWEIELQGTAIKLADTKVSVIASCARGKIDLTDYIDSIEDNTLTIKHNKGLAFVGDYSLMATIKSDNLATLNVQEKYVFRTIEKNDPTDTESIVSIRSSIVASGGYDSALSEVSQNAIQNAPVAKEFAKVYHAIDELQQETENSIKQSVEEGIGNVLGGASEAYDTLKEIEEYIERDEAGAVALAQSITRLETEKVSKEDIDSALSNESENPVQNKVITVALNEKVDKVSGKGLSTNDYTTSDKDKLASLENYDDSEIRTSLEEVETQIESQDALIKDLQDGKANKEGNYPSLRVGTADTADDLAGRGESVPAEFGFRASGGKSIKDGRAYIKRIKGNSVVWNQLVPSFKANKWYISPTHAEKEFINNGVRLTFNIDQDSAPANGVVIVMTDTSSSFANHAYLTMVEFKPSRTISVSARNFHSPWGGAYHTTAEEGKWTTLAYIYTPTTDYEGYLMLGTEHSTDVIKGETLEIRNARVIDLTKMFGAGNEPTTIEDFYARVATLGIDMNAYKEGQVIHCNTESIKSVGDNAWDEEWEVGTYDSENGKKIDSDATIRSKNLIKVLPNTEYYICVPQDLYGTYPVRQRFYREDGSYIGSAGQNTTGGIFNTPADCAYVGLIIYSTTYNHDITISLYHSGWKAEVDNTYKPYWEDTLPLPIIRKYFPDGMKSAGTAHDEIRYNKVTQKWETVQRIGEVDLGTLSWRLGSGRMIASANFASASHSANTKVGNILTQKYMTLPYNNDSQPSVYTGSLGIAILKDSGEYYLSVYDSAYTDAASFKADMSGVMLYYELAEPIVTELDAEDQNFRDYYNVADFGTEQSQSSVPSAPFSADIIYQFNAVDMIREHEIEITELQSVIATMQAQLTSLINGGQ